MDVVDLTLVLGGTRSGKSAFAETLVGETQDIVYVAPMVPAPQDLEFQERIASHKRRRPVTWSTYEAESLEALLQFLTVASGPILLDSLGSMMSRIISEELVRPKDYLERFVYALASLRTPTIVVSEEVGLSIHPLSPMGRDFVDLLGELNQRVAMLSKKVIMVIAGIPLLIKDQEQSVFDA